MKRSYRQDGLICLALLYQWPAWISVMLLSLYWADSWVRDSADPGSVILSPAPLIFPGRFHEFRQKQNPTEIVKVNL